MLFLKRRSNFAAVKVIRPTCCYRFLLLPVVIVFTVIQSAYAQNTEVKLDGFIQDEQGKSLPGATILISPPFKGITTNEEGYFSTLLVPGQYTITFSFIGFSSDTLAINLMASQTIVRKLKSSTTLIDEVLITENSADQQILQTETGHIHIKKEEFENIPFLLGEIDPVRMIQLMPGIHTAGEGSTGFYVRGGAVDQNMMFLDNTVIYNPSHLFGFFSIFNGSTINSIDLYKSGMPASYGGRLSSFTDIHTRNGNAEGIHGEGSLGVIAANALVEGPIKKNKSSFLVAARRTYVDLFLEPLRDMRIIKQDVNYYFYDLNVNADFQLGKKDHLRFRSYLGQDNFEYSSKVDFENLMRWKNAAASLSWLHQFNTNLYSELMVGSSLYDMSFGATISTYNFDIKSDILDYNGAYQLNLEAGKHHFTAGVAYTQHALQPNNISAASEDVALNITPSIKLHADESAFYINDKIVFSDRWEVNTGIRLVQYRQLGPFSRYIQDENFQVLDTVYYTSHKPVQKYFNAEPRFAVRYSLNESSSIKFSYDRTYQYMHMAPLSSVSLPLDIWVPSSSQIKPQFANQFSAGYFRNFQNNTIETSAAVYYKDMHNQIEYREGVIIGYSKGYNFDDNFVFGKGTSYGAEVAIKKNAGKINGQISYTLSRTTRQFSSLNEGKSFAAKYDRLHDFSTVVNYRLNDRWTFSGVFVYGTGNALNLPIARYVIQGNIVNEYGERNAFRMPPYHRMDLSATFSARKSKHFESYWVFSIYNVYNRKNPYYIYFETTGNLEEYELDTSIQQVSLFPIIPAVTYRLKF